jgi:hypothetical protein
LFFILLLAIFVGWVINSEYCANKLLRYAINSAVSSGQVELSLDQFTGTIEGGVSIKGLKGKDPRTLTSFEVDSVDLKFDLTGFITRRGVGVLIDCNEISLVASRTLPDFSRLPSIPQLGCIVATPIPVNIRRAVVNKVKLGFEDNEQVKLELDSIELLEPASGISTQSLSLGFSAFVLKSKLGSGAFKGSLNQRSKRIDGNLSACVVGQKFKSEITCVFKRKEKDIAINGYLASGSLDIAKFSQWLIPLWQDYLPFGFDGKIGFQGPWMISRKIGFLGNLNGNLRNARIVALGIFYPVANFNANWRLFDGNIEFKDQGSEVFGFPAKLSGKLLAALTRARNWQIDVDVPEIDMSLFADKLPWGMKYTLDLPKMVGLASLTMNLRGRRPGFFGMIQSSKIAIGKGKASFRLPKLGPGIGNGHFELDCPNGLTESWREFSAQGKNLRHVRLLQGPLKAEGDFKGQPYSSITMSGKIYAGKEQIKMSGVWNQSGSRVGIFVPFFRAKGGILEFVTHDIGIPQFLFSN